MLDFIDLIGLFVAVVIAVDTLKAIKKAADDMSDHQR